MDIRETIVSQYHAALEMLKQSILACPETLWYRPDDINPTSQVAYHTLFFTHLYLQESRSAFAPWFKHREAYRFEKDLEAHPAESPTKAVVLEYLAFCQGQVMANVPAMNLDGASGFDWLPFTKFELQLYSIRHIQHHTGELMERLGTNAWEIDWIGSYHTNISTETV